MSVSDYDVGVVKALDHLVNTLNKSCPYIRRDIGWGSSERHWKVSDFKFNKKTKTIKVVHISCSLNHEEKCAPEGIMCNKCQRYITRYTQDIRNMDRKFFSYQAIIDKINEIDERLGALEKRVDTLVPQ